MRARWVSAVAFASICGVVAGVPAARADVPLGAARPDAETVYVATAGGPVTAYPTGSSGPVRPTLTLRNPRDPQTVWDPWSVAFDAAGDLYVQSFLSDATTFVYDPGSTEPAARFAVTAPDSQAIAVDGSGDEYVMGGEGPPIISVAAPGANGTAADQYRVPAVRTIPTDQAGFEPWPDTLASGPAGEVTAAVLGSPDNALESFATAPGSSARPVRVISGPRTGLGSCPGTNSCDHVVVTWAASTGRICVGVSTATGSSISVFAAGARGDAAPLQTIAGPATGLVGAVITGIAVSPADGIIYVMVRSSQFGGKGSVEAFGRTSQGDQAPLRSFTDASSGFRNALGIAVGAG